MNSSHINLCLEVKFTAVFDSMQQDFSSRSSQLWECTVNDIFIRSGQRFLCYFLGCLLCWCYFLIYGAFYVQQR